MGQKNSFGGMFGRSVKISAGQLQMKFQNLGKCWVKIQKMCTFFSQMQLKMSNHA